MCCHAIHHRLSQPSTELLQEMDALDVLALRDVMFADRPLPNITPGHVDSPDELPLLKIAMPIDIRQSTNISVVPR